MSDGPAPPSPRETWRAARWAERAAASARLDDRLALWSGFLLVAMLLYMMIGTAPYTHEVTVDALSGASPTSPLNRAIWLAILGLTLPILWFRRAEVMALAMRVWPLLLLFVWFGATTSWAIDPIVSNRRFILYLINVVVSIALVAGLRDPRRMHAALATACAIMIIIDVASWIALPGLSMTDIGLAAIHNHKNTLGSVMLLSSLVITPYLLFSKTVKARLFWGVMFAGCIALLVASKSKTSLAIALAALAATPLLLACLRLRAGAIWAAAVFGVAALLAAGFGWLAWNYAIGQDPLAPLRGVNFTRRTEVWMFALNQFSQHPLRGQGFGSFWDVNPAVQPSLQTDLWFAAETHTNQSHNGYIDLLVTVGAPGLAGALLLLLRWMSRGLGLVRESLRDPTPRSREALPHAVFLGVFPLIFFVHNFMESSYFSANAMLGILILLFGVDIDMRHTPAKEGRVASPRLRVGPIAASPR